MVASHVLWFLFLLRAAGHAAVEPCYQTSRVLGWAYGHEGSTSAAAALGSNPGRFTNWEVTQHSSEYASVDVSRSRAGPPSGSVSRPPGVWITLPRAFPVEEAVRDRRCRTKRCEARTQGVQEPRAGAPSRPGQSQAPQHHSNLSQVTKLCAISFCGAIEMNRFSSSKHHEQSRCHCQF